MNAPRAAATRAELAIARGRAAASTPAGADPADAPAAGEPPPDG